MRMPLIAFTFFLILTACQKKSGIEVSYSQISKKNETEISRILCEKPPKERVLLYLYGVENVRPSDYGLMPTGCIDNDVVNFSVNLLRDSSSENRTFGLIALIHESPAIVLSKRHDRFIASSACSKFFRKGSSCHSLASDIDAIYGKK